MINYIIIPLTQETEMPCEEKFVINNIIWNDKWNLSMYYNHMHYVEFYVTWKTAKKYLFNNVTYTILATSKSIITELKGNMSQKAIKHNLLI